MRCFIAIDIDREIRDGLRQVQQRVIRHTKVYPPKVKWVDVDNMHLTIKFLGEVSDKVLPEVCNVTAEVVGSFNSFELEFTRMGTFGRQARVLWMGIKPVATLEKLVERLSGELAELGFEPEKRKFAPHLTLCRIKSPGAGAKISRYLSDAASKNLPSQPISSLCVYKSDLTKSGPVYTLLSRCLLR